MDLSREWTIDDARIHSRAKISPWDGRPVSGLPIHTMVRGRFVVRDRELMSNGRGWGRSVNSVQTMPTPTPKPANLGETTAAILPRIPEPT